MLYRRNTYTAGAKVQWGEFLYFILYMYITYTIFCLDLPLSTRTRPAYQINDANRQREHIP